MIPNELDGTDLVIPPAGDGAIVIITGTEPRHVRFALRLQQQFGERVKRWYQVAGSWRVETRVKRQSTSPQVLQMISHLRAPWQTARKLKRSVQRAQRQVAENLTRSNHPAVEAAFFEGELRRLNAAAIVKPKRVEDPNDGATLAEIRQIKPFLLLTLGGAIYRKPMLELVRGLPLNQHDGWCPEYRGTHTVDWALYHRDLRRFGNTVHLTTSGMDAGPIIRRTQPCLVPWDTPYTCFLRNVVVGTELMCEVVQDVVDGRPVKVYPQPDTEGSTFLFKDMTLSVKESIRRDFKSGWLREEMHRLRASW